MALQVTRADALELFEALGSTTANKWNTKRLAAKLSTIDKMVDEDTQLEGNADKTLTTVLKAIEAEYDIMIVEPARKAEPEPVEEAESKPTTDEEKPKPKKSKKAAAPVEEPKLESEGEEFAELKARFDAGEITAKQFAAQRRVLLKGKKAESVSVTDEEKPKPKKKAKAADKKPAKAAKPAKPKAEKQEVTQKNTRPFLAGVVIKKHGVSDGVTDGMVKDLNDAYGKKNDRESAAMLRMALQVVQGFVS